MLSRSNSAATDRIHRSNSSSAARQHARCALSSDSVDAETVHIHALIAAHRAMDRSRGSHSQTLGRSESTTSHTSNIRARPFQYRQCSPASELRRQRSILQAKTPSLAGSQLFTKEYGYDGLQIDTTYLPLTSEFGENHDAEPSSYRKLRKTRSMLTPDHHGRHSYSDGSKTPFSQARTLRHAVSNIGIRQTNMGLRLRRSLNLLRTPSRVLSSPSKSNSDVPPCPEAIRLAREQFFQKLGENSTSEQTSLVSHPKRARKQKALRKSMKTSPERGTDIDTESECSDPEITHVRKVRSISASLRNRFKKVFSKSKPNESSFPPQQLESSRPHFGESTLCQYTGFDSYNEESRDHATRNTFYISSSDGASNPADVENMWQTIHPSDSHESATSNSRSRVTSWTDSTVTGSLRGSCVEHKRLSVIKEDGSPHQPSSSAGRHLGGVAVTRQPLQSFRGNGPTSKRLYSALVKHMNREHTDLSDMNSRNVDYSKLKKDTTEGSNVEICTIRPISSQSTINSVAPDLEHGETNLNKSSWRNSSGMTPEKLSRNVNRRKQKLKAQEAQSSFFPYSAEDIPEATSPFRKMMLARRSGEENSFKAEEETSQSLEGVKICNNRLPDKKQTLSSESIYSRTTHGGINPQYERPVFSSEDLPLNFEESAQDTGFATIVPTRSCTKGLRAKPDDTTMSSLMSAEKNVWKGWAEDQMSSLRRSSSKASRHVREKAQISPEQKSNKIQEKSANDSKEFVLLLANSQSNTNRNMRTPTPYSMVSEQLTVPKRRFPLLDVKEVSSRNTPAPSKNDSISHSQSGLLKTSTEKQSELAEGKDPGVAGKLSASLRKISPTTVARFLRGRKNSTSTVLRSEADKENKYKMNASTPTRDRLVQPDLQTWSGNAKSKTCRVGDSVNEFDESPSDRVKATLSARLSRPFDMETPECNRPFDSMYLGKREAGHSDYLGSRLSVANGPIRKRGLHGYGGLGTPILHRQIPDEETTALPHFPSPEDEYKRRGFRVGMPLSSKRMVSNFLRSRRSTLTENRRGHEVGNTRDGTDEK